jgi:hypothetical protein
MKASNANAGPISRRQCSRSTWLQRFPAGMTVWFVTGPLNCRPEVRGPMAGFLAAVVTIVALRSLLPEGTPRLRTRAGAGALGPLAVAEVRSVRVIAWQVTEVGSGRQVLLRLRTRDGVFSRDGSGDLGCLIDDEWAANDEGAALAGGDTLVVHTTAGEERQVRFNPKTLHPVTPMIDRCTTAPGSTASPVPTTTN